MNAEVSPNRETLVQVADQLRPLLPSIVFVGGQVAELLVTDTVATRIRPTFDVDIVVSACGRLEYRSVEIQLEELGLKNDISSDVMCRWLTTEGHQVDVMTQDEDVLGFSNQWYALVLERAIAYQLTPDLEIRIPPAPVFLATKWEAFLNRGEGDHLGSHDLEDIITVVAGRPELPSELRAEEIELRQWLSDRVTEFLDHSDHYYALEGALPDIQLIPELLDEIQDRFREFVLA
jgi:hypothetical protein